MPDVESVLIDTNLWVEFFSRKRSKHTLEIQRLLLAGKVVTAGPILYEVLIGPKRDDHRYWLQSRLSALPFLDIDLAIWRHAVELGRIPSVLRSKVPITDVLIAAVAFEYDCAVYSLDPHFDLFPDLPRWT
jgi:predicted nucleic acid-binding protein